MTSPRCPFEDEVLLLGDGEIGFTRRIVVEAHLGVCAACASLEETVAAVDEAVADAHTEPLDAVERALARLPDATPVLRPYLLAAAAAALVFVALRAGIDRPQPAATPSPAADVAAAPVRGDDPADTGQADARDAANPAEREDQAVVAFPSLPPPLPPVGPTLRRRLAELDLLRPDLDTAALAIARDVRRRGPRGARALAEMLGRDDALLRPALEVAGRMDSPVVAAALARLVDHPLYGDLAARSLAEAGDPAVVPELALQLTGRGRAAARRALVEIGGPAAARALVRGFWEAPPGPRRALLGAAVRADAAVGGAACLEAAATPAAADASPAEAPDGVARTVIAERAELLLPYLRRTARGRDTLRTRLAARGLGWARDVQSEALLAALARTSRTAGPATSALLDLGTTAALDAAIDAARVGGTDGPAARAFVGRAVAEFRLIAMTRGRDAAGRRLALALLSRCGGPPAAEALGGVEFPRDQMDEVVATLAAIGGPEAAGSLGPLAEIAGLEQSVVAALGETASARAVPWLTRIAAAEPRRRAHVVAALARIDGPESLAALVAMLRDDRAGAAALDVVAGLPARRVVPALLEHCGATVPTPVRRALARIAGRDLGSSPTPWREWWAART